MIRRILAPCAGLASCRDLASQLEFAITCCLRLRVYLQITSSSFEEWREQNDTCGGVSASHAATADLRRR